MQEAIEFNRITQGYQRSLEASLTPDLYDGLSSINTPACHQRHLPHDKETTERETQRNLITARPMQCDQPNDMIHRSKRKEDQVT